MGLNDDDPVSAEATPGESVAVSRKKILLRILAQHEASRLGYAASTSEVQSSSESFRRMFQLLARADFESWLTAAGLDPADFQELMRQAAVVAKVEAHYAAEVERGLPLQRRAQTVYSWRRTVPRDDEVRGDCPLCGAGRTPPGLPVQNQDEPTSKWSQLNIEVTRSDRRAAANAVRVFARLLPLVSRDTRPAALEVFFITRKPPDLRIRLGGADQTALRAVFGQAAEDLIKDGAAVRAFFTPYEPERFLFGTTAVLDCAHAYFDSDTLQWMQWERLAETGANHLNREVVCLGVLNDLFLSTVEDRNEVWDIWCNLALHHRLSMTEAETQPQAPFVTLAELVSLAGAEESQLLERYRIANQAFAAGMAKTASQGALTVGLRRLLMFVALFHLNRYGLSADGRKRVILSMVHRLDPRRGSRDA